jgi:hypothetical protein
VYFQVFQSFLDRFQLLSSTEMEPNSDLSKFSSKFLRITELVNQLSNPPQLESALLSNIQAASFSESAKQSEFHSLPKTQLVVLSGHSKASLQESRVTLLKELLKVSFLTLVIITSKSNAPMVKENQPKPSLPLTYNLKLP